MLWNLSAFERRTALIAAQGTMTYGDLCAAAERIAAPLRERTLVFLLARNSPAAIAGYVGFLQHGIVPVMVDAALDTELLMALRTAYRRSSRSPALGGVCTSRFGGKGSLFAP